MFRFTVREQIGARLHRFPLAIYDAFPAVLFGRMLVLSVRTGVFDALERNPLLRKELSARLNLPTASLELILPALAQAGYLREAKGMYHLTPESRKWLVRSSPHYLGNFLAYIELLHSH